MLALRGWVCDRYTAGGMQGASLLARAAAARSARRCSKSATLARRGPRLAREPRQGDALSPWRRRAGPIRSCRHDRLPFIFANRCGASLATIAATLRHRPDAKVVWFDAHGDFNTPETTPTGYLGGMVLTALCGLWDFGFGAGLSPDRIVLVGPRDLDPGEGELIAAHGVRLIAGEDGTIDAERVIEAVGGAPVWLHIDTDVVDPLYLPAEYQGDRGLRPVALRALLRDLVAHERTRRFRTDRIRSPVESATSRPRGSSGHAHDRTRASPDWMLENLHNQRVGSVS